MRYDEKEKVWETDYEVDRFYPDETKELVFDNLWSIPFTFNFSGWHTIDAIINHIYDAIDTFLEDYNGVDKHFVDFPVKFMVGDLDEDGDQVGDDYELTPEMFDNDSEFLFDYLERENGVVLVYIYR